MEFVKERDAILLFQDAGELSLLYLKSVGLVVLIEGLWTLLIHCCYSLSLHNIFVIFWIPEGSHHVL